MGTNRRILIDNATLSGVERLTGTSKIANLNNIPNDILCLEKLVTAILFSDEIIAIDDYKDAYRSVRLKNFDFANFLKIDEDRHKSLSTEAAAFARSMTFGFEGAKPAGDVIRFFESLRIDPQLRWDVFVSSEYLTLTFLVDDTRKASYEASIDSVFRNEDTDRNLIDLETDVCPALNVAGRTDIVDIKQLVHALASNNAQFKGMDGKSALDRIFFGYGWAAGRSYFYNAVAQMEGADVHLAPLRDAFCESCCRIDYPSQVTSLLEALKAKSQEVICSILEPSGHAKFAMRLPFFTAYLISKTDNPRQCIDLALKLRSDSEFAECRTIFHNFSHFTASQRLQEVNKALRYLEQSCSNLMKKYAVQTSNGLQFSLSLGVTGVGASVGLKLDELFRSYRHRPFSRVVRNIAQDMLNVERLGGLYEKVCSSVRPHREASYASISATPKFMEDRSNERGRPVDF